MICGDLRNVDSIDLLVLLLVAGVAHDCAVAVREDVGHLKKHIFY
jgi:hypothetical protein